MSTTDDRFVPVAERIRRLLAKAESTDSVHEAEALSAAAERLMLRHSIDAAMLDAGRERPDAVGTRSWDFTGTYALRWVYFLFRIAEGLGSSKSIRTSLHRGERITVVAFESDLDVLDVLFTSLQQQALTAQKQWIASQPAWTWMSPADRTRERGSFLLGFAIAVYNRLSEERRIAEGEAEAATPGTGLVLASKTDMVKAAFAQQFTDTRRGRGVSASAGGHRAGTAAGARASTTNTARITRPSAIHA